MINEKSNLSSKPNFWFCLSLSCALYFATISLYYGLSQNYLIQDDARIHIVWLQRFSDPELFPNDFLADYFVYFAPWGEKAVYWLGAKLGIEPLILAKILPAPLGIATAIYVYLWSLEILPKPFTAFLSSLMMSQLIWTNDDLVSATPRAFIYPLLAAFFYYLAKENIVACLVTMLLMGLFYPQVLLVETAILGIRLIDWQRKSLTKEKDKYHWFVAGLIVTAIALIPYTIREPIWETVSAAEMRKLPEFNAGGRTFFYGVSWLRFILAGDSGFGLPNFPPIIWLGFTLPWLLRKPLQTIQSITPKINTLSQTVVASLVMYLFAHGMLLKLHMPSRYTYHTLRFVLTIAFAIVFTCCVELSLNWLKQHNNLNAQEKIATILLIAFLTVATIFPTIPPVVNGWMQNWHGGTQQEIYQYLSLQPKNTLVASLSNKGNNIPAFSLRSILVSEEFAFPYHPYYHEEIIKRAKATILAQYATTKQPLLNFIESYGADYILLDRNAYNLQYLTTKDWLIYSSWQDTTQNAIASLQNNESFILPTLINSCTVTSTAETYLLSTDCITQQLEKSFTAE